MTQDFDEQKFHESLPKGMRHAVFVVASDMEDLANKCNALVGRVYENKETSEGYFISGIMQIVTKDAREFHITGEDEHPRPVAVIHAIVLPEYEEIPRSEGYPEVTLESE